MKTWGTVALILLLATLAQAQNVLPPSQPYPLPDGVLHTIDELAVKTDVLILGETHGTQETPAIAAALVAPLTKLGYGILALEVPADQQAPLIAWAAGKSSKIPWFYSAPWEDGRGSAEMLALIRTALSPPFRWRLICFDESIGNAIQENSFVNRDKQMAKIFAAQRGEIGGQAKTLAICGSLHARTANYRSATDSFYSTVFPSFAVNLQTAHPTWRINSINLNPGVGQFYNGGKTITFFDKRFDETAARVIFNWDWNLQLDFPKATAATFLTTPSNENAEVAIKAQLELLKKQPSESHECEFYSRRGRSRRCR